MTTKYTPGPWRVTSAGFDEGTEVNEATYVVAADPHMELSLANARLIAAAPELVDALRAIQKTMDGYRSQMKFCDVEALSYFREFDRRIEASGFRALLAKIDGEQS
jgi:hypothetical protein